LLAPSRRKVTHASSPARHGKRRWAYARHIIIVGGGVGGTIVANLLARTLRPDEAQVTLIDSTGKHVYMPGWLYVPFQENGSDTSHLVHSERSLLSRRVKLVTGEVTNIDTARRELHVKSAKDSNEIIGTGGAVDATYAFDYLVLATGARLAPEDLPGLTTGPANWHDFYSAEGAMRLKTALRDFQGGDLVVAVGGVPYRCPPAPLEFTFWWMSG